MVERNWYFDGKYPPGNWLARSMSHDTTLYREIAEIREIQGTDESILAGVMLLEVADAVDAWFLEHPEEPYGYAQMLLDFDESDAVADAENEWFRMPGNKERQEELWHQEYLHRLGNATAILSDVGFVVTGTADRHQMEFKMLASHPFLTGEEGAEKAAEALKYKDESRAYGFYYDLHENGLVTIEYATCPPVGSFEPVVQQMVDII